MNEQCLLAILPTSVSVHVLREWLNLKSLTDFDSACCNRSLRQEFHEVIHTDEMRLYQKMITSDYTTSYSRCISASASSRIIIIEKDVVQQREHFPLVMEYIQKYGPLVRAVTIRNLHPRCSEVIDAVTSSCCFLTSLTHGTSSVATLLPILLANRNLEKLCVTAELDEADLVSGFSFKDNNLPRLRTLGCRSMFGIADCIRAGNSITRLDISKSSMTTAEYTQLTLLLPQLRALCVASSMIRDEALDVVTRHCPHIMHLDLGGCLLVTDVGMESVVKNLKGLQSLCIEGCSALSWQSLVHIYTHAAENLQILCMTSLITEPVLRDVHHRTLDKLFERCQNLRSLAWTEISLDGLVYTLSPYIRNLTTLKLGQSAICDGNMQAVANYCPHLTHLSIRLQNDLEHVEYSNTGLKHLVFGCPQLQVVEISILEIDMRLYHPFADLAMDLWRFVRPELKIIETDDVDPCFVFDALTMPI